MKSIGAEFLRSASLPGVNHMSYTCIGTHTFLLISGGAITARKHNSSILIGLRHPVIDALFGSGSRMFECDDHVHTGVA